MSHIRTRRRTRKVTKKLKYMSTILELVPLDAVDKFLAVKSDPSQLNSFVFELLSALNLPIHKSRNGVLHPLDPVILNPETDVWDCCLIDYVATTLHWVNEQWIDDTKRKIFNDDSWNNHSRHATVCTSLALATAYLILRQMQLWHMSKRDCSKENCERATLEFFKLMLGVAEQEPTDPSKADEYDEFQAKFVGILSVLRPEAASELTEHIINRILKFPRLMQAVFTMPKPSSSKTVNEHCYLNLPKLPQQINGKGVIWPPPLTEAVSSDLVQNYRSQFPAAVTRHLPQTEYNVSNEATVSEEQGDEQTNLNEWAPDVERKTASAKSATEMQNLFRQILSTLTDVELKQMSKVTPTDRDAILDEFLCDISASDDVVQYFRSFADYLSDTFLSTLAETSA